MHFVCALQYKGFSLSPPSPRVRFSRFIFFCIIILDQSDYYSAQFYDRFSRSLRSSWWRIVTHAYFWSRGRSFLRSPACALIGSYRSCFSPRFGFRFSRWCVRFVRRVVEIFVARFGDSFFFFASLMSYF